MVLFCRIDVLAGLSIYAGSLFRRFAFVVYDTIYGYIGISTKLLRDVRDFTAALLYVIVSGTIVIVALVVLARRMGRE
jgi:hypothetical protein